MRYEGRGQQPPQPPTRVQPRDVIQREERALVQVSSQDADTASDRSCPSSNSPTPHTAQGTMASFFTSLFQWFSGQVPHTYPWYHTTHG